MQCLSSRKYTQSKYCHIWSTYWTSNITMYIGSLITEDGRSEKEIKRRRMIAQHRMHLPKWEHRRCCGRLRAIKRYVWPTLFYGDWSRDMDNYKITVVQTWCLGDVDISQTIENIMDGNCYQQGRIEKDGNRQRNSATIQDEETIRHLDITHHSYN